MSNDNNNYDKQAFEEAMDDVHTRFILNLPDEELASSDRIFFQLEQAWWFYDDFICDGNTGNDKKKLPRFKHMKPFSLAMFNFSPLLQPLIPKFDTMYAEFSKYKRSISTYGTILLNMDGTKIALCRNWKGKSWTLPGGKVNQNESGKDAAARETYEETGFDPNSEKGVCMEWREMTERGEVVEELLLLNNGDNSDDDEGGGGLILLPWEPLQDSDKLVYTEKDTNKRRTCYVCRGVPENFPFEPVARKEVAEVAWHDFNSLPKNNYAVMPFMGQLKRWIKRDNKRRGIKNRDESRAGSRSKQQQQQQQQQNQTPSKQKDYPSSPTASSRKGSAPRSSSSKRDRSRGKNTSRSGSRGREVREGNKLIESGLASPGQTDRWTEEEMFATNEKILGKKYTYDGNPHDFAEKGFHVEGAERVDPHHFRVVGGGFMNSADGANISAPPKASALQPLVYQGRSRSRSGASSNYSGTSGGDAGDNYHDDDDLEFTPFFSDDGKAPWEEGAVTTILPPFEDDDEPTSTPPPIRSAHPTQSNSKGLALLNQLRQGRTAGDDTEQADKNLNANNDGRNTRRTKKDAKKANASEDDIFLTDKEITARSQIQKLGSPSPTGGCENEHMIWMKQWVQNLPKSPPTKEFGSFQFDVEAILKAMAV